MKKFIKILSLIISTVLALSVFGCGCNENDDSASGHKVTTTLHKGVNDLKEVGRVFVKDKKSDYKIIAGEGSEINKAASFINMQVFGATGCNLGVSNSATYSSSSKYIVIGNKAVEKEANVTVTTENIGLSGYEVKTVGDSCFILANGEQGYWLGALAFLRAVIGYDCISADLIIYEKTGESLPNMDIIERPDFDFRYNVSTYTHSLDLAYPMGVQAQGSLFIQVDGAQVHNTFNYLDPTIYYNEHKNWYSEGERCNFGKNEWRGYPAQLCYTAHGNEQDLKELQNVLAEKVFELSKDSNKPIITITQQDQQTWCTCSKCKEILAEYGSNSASVIMFINAVDDIVQQKLQEYATANNKPKKELMLLFFAYQETKEPPTKIDDKVMCNDTVGIYCASSKTRYAYSFYDEINERDADFIKRWSKLGKLYMWTYEGNAMDYFVVPNTFLTAIENYRFLVENGACYISSQGSFKCFPTGFTGFREYLNSHAQFNVNVEFNEVKSKFFKYYYGDGGKMMEDFFDEVMVYMTDLRDKGYTDFNGVIINENPTQAKYWSKNLLERWKRLCDDALSAVASEETTNPSHYKAVRDHIVLDSLFPRYMLCCLFEKSYDEATIKQMRVELKADCEYFRIVDRGEFDMLDGLFNSWGV